MPNSKTKELKSIDYARNLVFSHPGLLNLDSSKTYVLEDINEQKNSLNNLATSISSQTVIEEAEMIIGAGSQPAPKYRIS